MAPQWFPTFQMCGQRPYTGKRRTVFRVVTVKDFILLFLTWF